MTVSSEIINVLDNLATKFGIAIDWGAENVVPYVSQLVEKYISWEIATSITWIVIMGIVLIIGIILIIADNVRCWEGFGICIGFVLCFICAIIIIGQIFDIIKCIHFPELQVIEYIQFLNDTM